MCPFYAIILLIGKMIKNMLNIDKKPFKKIYIRTLGGRWCKYRKTILGILKGLSDLE